MPVDDALWSGCRCALRIAVLALLWLALPVPAHAATLPPATDAALRTSDLIYVATRRRSGALSSIKPIWFAYTDGQIFFTTTPTSWKARRIATGSPVYVWVGSASGPFFEGAATRVTDAALIDRMGDAYAHKYWLAWLGLFKPRSGRVSDGKTNAYLVTPTHVGANEQPRSGR